MTEVKISNYLDGVTIRTHNKRAAIIEHADFIEICFRIVDKDEAHKPACKHTVLKGKVRQTQIKLSYEMMQAVAYAFLRRIEEKNSRTSE